MSMPVRVRCMCHVLPDSERKPTWLAPVLIPDDDVPPRDAIPGPSAGGPRGDHPRDVIPGHPTFEPQLQTLVEHLQQAAEKIGDHVATLGKKVAAMETDSESEASTVVKKFDDINSCLQELNQKVTSVVGLHGSIDEMQKKYADLKSAMEAMEEREQATSNKLSRAIRAIRHGEMPSSGSGDSGDSFCTEAAVADDAEDGAARPDLPVDGMGSSGVLVQHEKAFQLGASTFVSMAENHVSGTH